MVTRSDDFTHVGLSSTEAEARLNSDGPNELPSGEKHGVWHFIREIMQEPMVLLIVAAGTINFVLAEPLDGIILMATILVIIVITVYQERKTENALESLKDLSAPRALVIRDGVRVRIPSINVVRGDWIVISEGDRIPADAVLVDGVGVTVDESILTGESVPVLKLPLRRDEADSGQTPHGRPGGENTPWIFSGTLLVRGQGIAEVTTVGLHTELGRIGTALKDIEVGRTRLQNEITRLVQIFAFLGITAASGVVIAFGLTRGGWLEGFLAGIATAMSVLPEEFPVILTIFLAFGSWRMSQERVLARRPAVIETLGSATVICVDKTGTLTMNSMTVSELIIEGDSCVVKGKTLPEKFHVLAEYSVLASPIHPFDPMDRAFRRLEEEFLLGTDHAHATWKLEREYPLTSDFLAVAYAWDDTETHSYVIAAKGAPEAVAELCRLSKGQREELVARVTTATNNGQRVLAVASAQLDKNSPLPDTAHDFDFHLLGLAGLHDPVRPGVSEAVHQCATAGVRTVMITGDFPGTALAIAREIGLANTEACITGPEMMAMSIEELAEQVRTVDVYARMIPEQKLQLVRAFKSNGDVVGMTGDGVNDAPALRAADIGIAMGGRGTDVAREAAALVITDDDFASITAGIRRGRGIFDNLRKAMSYLIAVHIHIVGMAVIPLFFPSWPLVLMPLQISFLELIIDPTCSILFEMEQVDPNVMNQPPRKVGSSMFNKRALLIAIFQGLSVLTSAIAVYVWAAQSGFSDEVVRSITFSALVLSNLGLLLVNRSWRLPIWKTLQQRRNPAVKWIISIAMSFLIAMMTIPVLREVFHFGAMSPRQALIASASAVVGVAWFEVFKKFNSLR